MVSHHNIVSPQNGDTRGGLLPPKQRHCIIPVELWEWGMKGNAAKMFEFQSWVKKMFLYTRVQLNHLFLFTFLEVFNRNEKISLTSPRLTRFKNSFQRSFINKRLPNNSRLSNSFFSRSKISSSEKFLSGMLLLASSGSYSSRFAFNKSLNSSIIFCCTLGCLMM